MYLNSKLIHTCMYVYLFIYSFSSGRWEKRCDLPTSVSLDTTKRISHVGQAVVNLWRVRRGKYRSKEVKKKKTQHVIIVLSTLTHKNEMF